MASERATITSPTQLLNKLDHSDFTRRHSLIYGTAIAGHFLDGFAINMTGVVLPGVIHTFSLTSKQAGYLSSVLFLGMLVGAAVAGVVSDRLGRKFPLAVCLLVFAAFSVLAACAWDYPSLMTARFCQGIGLGAEIAIVLPYITEFVPSRHRGALISAATAAWLIGIPVAAVVGAGVVPALSWRAMFVIGAAPVLVSVVMMAVLPESVRYLLRKGRYDAAHDIVGALATDPRPGTGHAAATGTAPVADGAGPAPIEESDRSWVGSVRNLVRAQYLTYTLSLWFMELCAGAFLYGLAVWLPSILEKRGNSLLGSLTYTAIITAAGVAGALLAGQIVNRVGRRATMGVSFLVSGAFCLVWGGVDSTVAVVVLGCCATFFGSGLAGSTLFVYASELYPTANRATGLGWAAAWQKVGGLVIPTVIGWILAVNVPGYLFFVLFAVISVLAGVCALLATFETRGRTVEQITEALDAATPRGRARTVPARRRNPSAAHASRTPATELAAPDITAQYDPEQAGEG